MDKNEQLYFFWLLKFVCDRREIANYKLVLEDLYLKDYRWTLEMDENLAGWGLYLRERYIDESPTGRRYAKIYGESDKKCSVLEMMVALCINMEDKIASNEDFGDRTSEWFWGMMSCLGLDIYDNDHYFEDEIDEILENFLDRKVQKDGKGGLFPQKVGRQKCQKTKNFWEQATNYLSEVLENNGEIW